MQTSQILHKSTLKALAPSQEDQKPKDRIQQLHLNEFVHSGQVTLPEESDQLRLHCHSAISPLGLSARSHVAHLDEFVYSGQVTLPEESDQLRLHCHSATLPLGLSARSHVSHLDEFVYSGQVTLPEESDQLRLHCHSTTLPLGLSAWSHIAHPDEFVYSGQVTLPEESDHLRQHCHSAKSPHGLNATKATAPGAQLLTLTSPSTPPRPCCLRSQNSSGYIAIWLERHKGHSARSLVAHFDKPVYPAQAMLPQESDQLRLHRHLA